MEHGRNNAREAAGGGYLYPKYLQWTRRQVPPVMDLWIQAQVDTEGNGLLTVHSTPATSN